jgi:phage terminase small subunit
VSKQKKVGKPTAGGKTPAKIRPLSLKQLLFVAEYLVDLNATRAYMVAYGVKSETVAASAAARLLKNVKVAEAVAAGQAKRAQKLEITADQLVSRFWLIGTADPNELVQFRRTCCRHCYGKKNEYQYTTRELELKKAQHQASIAAWDKLEEAKRGSKPGAFDEGGGPGFNHTLPPAADCPECFGEGSGDAFIKDTRSLSPAAAALYAGVKVTKDGIEMKMHDQPGALVNVGKLLGYFTEKHQHDVGATLEEILTQSRTPK